MAASAQRRMLPRSPRAGLIAYLALTFTLAWIPALLLRGAWSAAPDAIATKHFVASAIYLFTMGCRTGPMDL